MNLPAKPYAHIIWDWNGTLLDDAPICVQVLNRVLAKYGKPPTTLARYRAQFGFPVEDYYRRLGFDFSVESYDAVADDYIALYRLRQFECPLHDGVPEVVDHCLRAGITQSILSAYQHDLLTEAVRHFGLVRSSSGWQGSATTSRPARWGKAEASSKAWA